MLVVAVQEATLTVAVLMALTVVQVAVVAVVAVTRVLQVQQTLVRVAVEETIDLCRQRLLVLVVQEL
jgi:hypothetical protein